MKHLKIPAILICAVLLATYVVPALIKGACWVLLALL